MGWAWVGTRICFPFFFHVLLFYAVFVVFLFFLSIFIFYCIFRVFCSRLTPTEAAERLRDPFPKTNLGVLPGLSLTALVSLRSCGMALRALNTTSVHTHRGGATLVVMSWGPPRPLVLVPSFTVTASVLRLCSVLAHLALCASVCGAALSLSCSMAVHAHCLRQRRA